MVTLFSKDHRLCEKAIANDIPVVLGNDVGCPWITQYDFWRELFYFHKYVGVSNASRFTPQPPALPKWPESEPKPEPSSPANPPILS